MYSPSIGLLRLHLHLSCGTFQFSMYVRAETLIIFYLCFLQVFFYLFQLYLHPSDYQCLGVNATNYDLPTEADVNSALRLLQQFPSRLDAIQVCIQTKYDNPAGESCDQSKYLHESYCGVMIVYSGRANGKMNCLEMREDLEDLEKGELL